MPFIIDTANNARFAEGSIDRLTGQPGLGFFRLIINLRLHMEAAAQPSRLTGIVGDLLVGSRPALRLHPSPQTLPIVQYPQSLTMQVALEGDLDRARLEAIEDVRNGGDLSLLLNLYTEVIEPAGETRTRNLQEQYQVNQGVWVGVLEQMQYRRTLLLEVPVPDAQAQPELSHAVDFLGRAQQALSRGDYREAVGLCRDVLEEMSKALGDTDPAPLQELFTGSRQMAKSERLRVLRQALKVFTNPARHRDEVAARFEWSRLDARSALMMTSALLDELGTPDARP